MSVKGRMSDRDKGTSGGDKEDRGRKEDDISKREEEVAEDGGLVMN